MAKSFLEILNERVVIWDGAMGTQLQAAGLSAADFTYDGVHLDGCNEILNLTRPDIIEEIHGRYYAAGSDIVETNTFGSTSVALGEYDRADLVPTVSLAAAQSARRAADKFSTPDRPRFVAGALGPGTKLVTLGQVSFDELERTYTESFAALLEGGVDVLLLETLQDLLMVKAGVIAAIAAMKRVGRTVPLIVQVTMEQTGTMLLGTEMAAALHFLEGFPEVTAIGMNCATGPQEMVSHIRFLSEHSTRPISIQPNAGLPAMERGQAVYKLTPDQLADWHHKFITEYGVALVGGCCGTTPAHIQAVAKRIGSHPHENVAHWQSVRAQFPNLSYNVTTEAQMDAFALRGSSSLYIFQPTEQENAFLIVGEKTNANGSKAFRENLAAENWEGLLEIGRELEAEGSHVLDVCAAYVGRDEVRDMQEILRRFNQHITVPLMIDSTELNVMEASLRTVAGRPIINSINFEDGETRPRRVLELCRKYGASIVALTINEQGMAKSRLDKLAVARRLIALTREHGLPDHDVFIDALTFTLGSGDEEFRGSAIETIEAIRLIRQEFPRVNAILGLSNVSFGLKPAARQVLNSVFLEEARRAGLNAAIVHYSKLVPESRVGSEIWKIGEDLVFDRRKFALA